MVEEKRPAQIQTVQELERIIEEERQKNQSTQSRLDKVETLLLKMAKSMETKNDSPTRYGYTTPARPGRSQINSRAAMIRASPVEKWKYREDPESYQATGMYDTYGEPIWGTPGNKDMKLQLAKFNAKETYKGLGTGIDEWVERFIRQIERAQLSSGFCWTESVKMDCLEDHLEGKALEYWQVKRKAWKHSTLEQAMKEKAKKDEGKKSSGADDNMD